MIKTIIFDFDGVLIDSYELHYQMSRKQIKDLTREEHKKLFEGNIHVQREKMKERFTDFEFKNELDKATMNKKISKIIQEAILKLSEEYSSGIISSGRENLIKSILENAGVLDKFIFIYGEETHKIKFNKFNIAFKKFSLKKEETIFVTDTLGDIFEADKIGIKSIAIDSGFHEKGRLEKGKPMKIIHEMSELEDILKDYPTFGSAKMFR